MLKPKRPQQFKLQQPTDIGALAEVLMWFERVALPFLSEQQFWQCQVALAEGFTNAVRHAHRDLPPKTAIDIEVRANVRFLEIKIWDRGKPFDLQSKLRELSQSEEDPLGKEGGRGLLFIQQLTDEMSYVRTRDRRNCLTIRKNL
ncbi:MAG: ATP-binding protein [Cyanobacteriota bacterium]|nr:ATP-binding protein [Cyanobacteriota bacterium]